MKACSTTRLADSVETACQVDGLQNLFYGCLVRGKGRGAGSPAVHCAAENACVLRFQPAFFTLGHAVVFGDSAPIHPHAIGVRFALA